MVMTLSGKTVVFVAGADFSGTTMLDFMLGSHSETKSLGEVHSFFRPTVAAQRKVVCSCGELCPFWKKAASVGEGDFYQYVFQEFSGVNVLIDSSKSIPWINKKTKELVNTGVVVKHVLIWKDAKKMQVSRAKRGKEKGWAASWLRYHRAYLALPRDFYSVSLSDIVEKYDVVGSELCEWIGIKFDLESKEYWKNEHHIVFGSATARLKLFHKGSCQYNDVLEMSNRDDLGALSFKSDKLKYHPTVRQLDGMSKIKKAIDGNEEKSIVGVSISGVIFLVMYYVKSVVERFFFKARYGSRKEIVDFS